MLKSFVFLVVFISAYLLVQGIDQQSSGSQCQCCDQCDQSATVSKLLLDISNLLVNDDLVNTTANPSTTSTFSTTAPPPTTTIGVTTTTVETTTTNPTTTQSPSAIVYSSDIRDSSTTLNASTVTDSSTVTNSTSKAESFAAVNVVAISDTSSTTTSSTTNPTTVATGYYSTSTLSDSSAKVAVCPKNCYLDITGVYCNCYQSSEQTEQTDGVKAFP